MKSVLVVGEVRLLVNDDRPGEAKVMQDGEVVGTVTAAGLLDAARIGDDRLSELAVEEGI